MKQIKKRTGRIVAMLLVLAMIVTSVPQYALTASAAEAEENTENVETIVSADEHVETENAAEAETEVKAAEATQEEKPTTAEKEEGTTAEETETVNETNAADASDTETETANASETEPETKTKPETEAETKSEIETETQIQATQEPESSEAEESETDAVLETGEDSDGGGTGDDTEIEKTTVTIRIPTAERGTRNPTIENLLSGFAYAVYETEPTEGSISLSEQYDGSFDELVSNKKYEFEIEVPKGYVLYFKPVLKDDIAELDWVSKSYDENDAVTADDKGIYKISDIQDYTQIYIEATRLYSIAFQAEHAKFYASEEALESGTALTNGKVPAKDGKKLTVLVEPDEGYTLRSIDSNNSAIKVVRDRDSSSYSISVNMNSKLAINEPVIILATAEILDEYDVTFDWSENDVEVFAYNEQLTQDKKSVKVTEGYYLSFDVRAKDSTKGIYVEYTDENSGETFVPRFDKVDEESDKYTYDTSGILGNVSVKISVVDYRTITFKTGSKYIGGFFYRYAGNGNSEESVDFNASNQESGVEIRIPDGYELRFWFDRESAYYGSSAASTEQGALKSRWDDSEMVDVFAFTPNADTTVTLDVKPAEFPIKADKGIEFSVCQYDTSQSAYVDLELSENNSIYYYNDIKNVYLKIKKEDKKRYEVSGEFDTWGGSTATDALTVEEEKDGYCYYAYERDGITIGTWHNITIKSYDTVTLTVEGHSENSSLFIRKFYGRHKDVNDEVVWQSDEIKLDYETETATISADKGRECFIGLQQDNYRYRYQLDYATGDVNGSLAFYEEYQERTDYGIMVWIIYKVVPTADTTVTITASQLEKYTVTVVKGDGITGYSAVQGINETGSYITDTNKVFEEITENATFKVDDIVLSDNTHVRKVEYAVDGGTRQPATGYYSPVQNQLMEYHIKMTGNTTIYLDSVPAKEYTLKFDNTDGYDVNIWEKGSHENYEEPTKLTNNQITFKNDKEFLFDIIPEDGYIVENVTAIDESGKETLVEKNIDWNHTNTGYCIGTGYGNTENITIKVKLSPAYTLNFDTTGGMDIYSWEDKAQENRLNYERIAIPVTDSYTFFVTEYDETRYKMSIKESDSFTLTKSFRTIYDEDDFSQTYTVYTVAAKKGVTQLAKTATIVIEENRDTHTVTISNYPVQVKSANISYYRTPDGYSENYKITEGKATVSNTVDNVVQIHTMSGYTAKVTMKGASGESELKQIRNENNYRDYWIGKLTEDKTITITVERDKTAYYGVGFLTRNAVIRDSEYKLPYSYTENYSENRYECDSYDYQIARGSSISFIVEPDFGYKVESVSVRDGEITPDKDGVYTVKPTRANEGIKVQTVPENNPDNPDDPDNPAKNAVIKFTYPAEVAITVNDYHLENDQVSIEIGKQITFEAKVTDNTYEIKSVTAGGMKIPYDTATGTYTVTINADTEIVITAEKKQGESENKYTVRFTYPQSVYVTVNGLQTDSVNNLAEGSKVSFSVICSDENYQIKSVKANGTDVDYDLGAGSYILTVTADTEVVIEAEKKPTAATKDPTEVRVKNVSNGRLSLSVTSRKHDIILTPTDADGSVLGVRVEPADSVIKASIVSETKGGRTMYYLLLEKPETSVGDTAEVTIYNKNTNEAIKGGTFTVVTKATSGGDTPDTSGLKVTFDGYDETETPSYTYTGSAVTPGLEVTYNGDYLEQGTDYTVKFANNINVSTDAKPAKLTITGKGSLTGKHDFTFKITPKDISESDVRAGSVKVAKGAKATPVLVYNGIVLGKKDFDNPKASEKFSADSTITLTGKGNYKGTREIKVEAVDKDKLNKINIKLNNAKNKNLTYDGNEKYPAFQVLDAKKADITSKVNEAYIVVYPEDIISAGTVKFTVVGIGDYTGTVTKSYKIKPSAKAATDMNISAPNSGGYTFVSTGVTEYDPDITLKDGTWLEKGRDYTLAYSNNKKAGTAKCKINFIGNYKGIKAVTKEFKINPFNISDFYAENIIVADQTSGGKPGTYKSVPYIIDNEVNALIKSSEFKFTYYVDEAMKKEMKGSDGKLTSGKIWVKIEPKKADKGNYTGTRTVSYKIWDKGGNLSKAKITFQPAKPVYTGSWIEPECFVDGKSIKGNEKYQVRYLSNINKGKATVIITCTDETGYIGSKTATFTITASNIN